MIQLPNAEYAALVAERDSLLVVKSELLEALEEVFVIGDRLVSDVYGHEFVEKARAAISKARGEA